MTTKIPRANRFALVWIHAKCMKHDFQCTVYKKLIGYILVIFLIACFYTMQFRSYVSHHLFTLSHQTSAMQFS
jgi:hypothetical protein